MDDSSKPRLLYLPIYITAGNSLTSDILFSLINNNFLMFLELGLCCQYSYILAPPLPPWSNLSVHLRCGPPGLKSSEYLPKKPPTPLNF